MTYKVLLFFYSCMMCLAASGQELQSPQLSQHAIFANPALAGQMGYARIGASLSTYKSSNFYDDQDSPNNYQTTKKRSFNNGLLSLDGLILNNKLGIGTYLKYETFERTDQTNYFNYNINTNKTLNTYTFSNVYMGFMVAPKFELKSKDEQKPSNLLSPALAIGFKGSQFNYMGNDFFNATLQDTTRNGQDINSFGLEYVSAGLVYSSPTSYSGIKLNFQNYLHSFILYDVSFLYSKTYFDKTVSTPRFSFTHQFQLTIPTYGFFNYSRYSTPFDKLNRNNLMHYFTANLDFKYDMYVLGMFVGLNDYDGVYAGLTAGIQIDRMKILVNYSPRFSSKEHGSSGLFVSANFYLKGKKN